MDMADKVIQKIKEKKPLDKLDDSFVNYFLQDFLKRNQKLRIKYNLNTLKQSEIKTAPIFVQIKPEINGWPR